MQTIRQAFITKYICPTNSNGARLSAKCEAMRIILPWDYALNPEANHIAAASELCKRIDDRNIAQYGSRRRTWSLSPKVCGQIPSGEYVHVFTGG